jgi:hypothetical protein
MRHEEKRIVSLPEELLEKVEGIAKHVESSHGLPLNADSLKTFLEDRSCVFHSVKVLFDAKPLKEDEYGYMHQVDRDPTKGFVLFLHPDFRDRPELHPALITYQLAVVNFGQNVDPEVAEYLGAKLVGMEVEVYYQHLCELTDSLKGTAT